MLNGRRNPLTISFFIVFLLLTFHRVANAESGTVNVGVYECPPFVIKNVDGTYSGLSIFLWQSIAEQLSLQYTMSYHELDDLLHGVSQGDLDIGVSCISITSQREKIIDFSHSYYETYKAIAVKRQGTFQVFINLLANKKLLLVLFFFCAAACIVGGIYYLLEHNINDKLYSMKSRGARLVEGFILGLLFITKGPFNYYEFRSLPGRVLTVFLAVVTTFFIASITAILASTFTVGLINSEIKTPSDLKGKAVGAIHGSTSSKALTENNIIHKTYGTLDELFTALDSGVVKAIVSDEAVLKYQIKAAKEKGDYEDLFVLPHQLDKQNYGFALKDNSSLIEELNQALLKVRRSTQWKQSLNSYLAE